MRRASGYAAWMSLEIPVQHSAHTILIIAPFGVMHFIDEYIADLLLALSGLLIAGANVSNILASRALRRRRTVGVLKALGASSGAVFRVFFAEALFVSAGGAVLGAGLSVLLSGLMEFTMDIAAVSGFMLAAGIFVSWLVVNALAILPSVQASRMPAAEAIRR